MRTSVDDIKSCNECDYYLDVSDVPNMQGLLAVCKLDLAVGCCLGSITNDCPIKNNSKILELLR